MEAEASDEGDKNCSEEEKQEVFLLFWVRIDYSVRFHRDDDARENKIWENNSIFKGQSHAERRKLK